MAELAPLVSTGIAQLDLREEQNGPSHYSCERGWGPGFMLEPCKKREELLA